MNTYIFCFLIKIAFLSFQNKDFQNDNILKVHQFMGEECANSLKLYYELTWCQKLDKLHESYYNNAEYDCQLFTYMFEDINHQTNFYHRCNKGHLGCIYKSSKDFDSDIEDWKNLFKCNN